MGRSPDFIAVLQMQVWSCTGTCARYRPAAGCQWIGLARDSADFSFLVAGEVVTVSTAETDDCHPDCAYSLRYSWTEPGGQYFARFMFSLVAVQSIVTAFDVGRNHLFLRITRHRQCLQRTRLHPNGDEPAVSDG
jgi:hypothetical protein